MNRLEKIKLWDIEGRRHVAGIVYEVSRIISRDDISIIDVGANSGLFFDMLRNKVRVKRAILFEPNTDLYEYMRNKYSGMIGVTVENLALSDSVRKYDLDVSSMESQMQTTPETGLNFGLSKVIYSDNGKSTCYSFDSISHRYDISEIDLIKVDTETEDLLILKGFTETVKRLNRRPIIVLESNWWAKYDYVDSRKIVDDFCETCGYRNIDINTRGDFYLFPI